MRGITIASEVSSTKKGDVAITLTFCFAEEYPFIIWAAVPNKRPVEWLKFRTEDAALIAYDAFVANPLHNPTR